MYIIDFFEQVCINGKPTRYYVSCNGYIQSIKNGKVYNMKVYKTKTGYEYVKFTINGKTRAEFVHRMVAKVFIPNPKNKPEVNHKDGVKSHNYVDNLEWVTSKENKEHAKKLNLYRPARGELSGRAVYTNKQIRNVCVLLEDNHKSVREISKITGVREDTIYGIRTKNIWLTITKNFTIPKIQTKRSRAYDESDIRKVCALLEKGMYTTEDIRKLTGVKKCTIQDIKHHRRWKYVSEKYNF